MPFPAFAAARQAYARIEADERNATAVKSVLESLPASTRAVGSRHGGPGNIEAVLGYDPWSKTVSYEGFAVVRRLKLMQ